MTATAPAIATAHVDLAATTNPITAWVDVVTGAAVNLGAIGTAWVEDPFPLFRQALENVFGYGVTTVQAVGGALNGALDYLSFRNENSLWSTLGTAATEIFSGEISTGFNTLINAIFINPLVNIGLPIFTSGLLDIPVKIAQNVANVVKSALSLENLLGLTLGVLGPLGGILASTGDSLQASFDALKGGNLIDAVFALVNIPAAITGAVLSGYENSEGTFLPGLFSFNPDNPSENGLFYTLLVSLPKALAEAIAPEAESEAFEATSSEDEMAAGSERRAMPVTEVAATSEEASDTVADSPQTTGEESTAPADDAGAGTVEDTAAPDATAEVGDPVTESADEDSTAPAPTDDQEAVDDIAEQLAAESAEETDADAAGAQADDAPQPDGAESAAGSSSDSSKSERRAARAA